MMKKVRRKAPQLILIAFTMMLFVVAVRLGMDFKNLFSTSLTKFAMNSVMVLAMVTMIRAGVGMNFGLAVGIMAGLLGMLATIQMRMSGMAGFLMAILFSIPIAVAAGILYGKILNQVRGKEDIAAIFIGYALIPLMDFFWTVAPFTNREMLYPIGGTGLRPKISLENYYSHVLNKLWQFDICGITIPAGMLCFVGFIALLLWLFLRTRVGEALSAVGENQGFCSLSGISVMKIRILAVVISTILGGIGIIVYAQSYGFVELYDGPSGFAFPAVSAILIGGCIGRKASIWQALLGAYLYQTIYLLSAPVANAVLIPQLAEIVRMIITNGIILYAFLRQRKEAVS